MDKIPDGYDAICRECDLPYTVSNSKVCGTVHVNLFCSSECEKDYEETEMAQKFIRSLTVPA